MSIRITWHGTFVSVNGAGILITGVPGVGKSKLAYDLLNRGHQFICDDAADLSIQGDHLIGQSPPAILNQLWLNGIGIMDVQKTWGPQVLLKAKKLDLLIHLVTQSMEPMMNSQLILGFSVPQLTISNQSNLIFFAENIAKNEQIILSELICWAPNRG